MPKPPSPHEADIFSLLQDVYGGDAADLRERGLSRAVGELEDTHRRAALAMRRLQDHGVPVPEVAARSLTPAQADASGAPKPGPGPTDTAVPVQSPMPSHAAEAKPADVVSGDGAPYTMPHHTLTHIIRPRGK